MKRVAKARENEANLSNEAKTHYALMNKADPLVKEFERARPKTDAGNRPKANSPPRARSSSGAGDEQDKRHERHNPSQWSSAPPHYAASGANFSEDRGRPMKLTDYERVKYKDSVCNRCGWKGHHGRHCPEKEALCFGCGSTGWLIAPRARLRAGIAAPAWAGP